MDTYHQADLKSSVEQMGRWVTQIITFKDGCKKTIEGVDSQSIKQGQFTKFTTKDGRMVMINDNNVNCVEVFREEAINDGR
jgi:hypothetical protein